MNKEFYLEVLKLLSALESWSFATKERLPDFLHERLQEICDKLQAEILK